MFLQNNKIIKGSTTESTKSKYYIVHLQTRESMLSAVVLNRQRRGYHAWLCYRSRKLVPSALSNTTYLEPRIRETTSLLYLYIATVARFVWLWKFIVIDFGKKASCSWYYSSTVPATVFASLSSTVVSRSTDDVCTEPALTQLAITQAVGLAAQ